MYGREYGEKELRFEPSGGLIHASLVMQDKETDSYWSIMSGESLAGKFAGTRLVEMPVGEKTQWADWKAEHPDTLVLSIDEVEHVEENPYTNYFESDEGFRQLEAADDRLPTKRPVYSIQLGERAYAIPTSDVEGGATFDLGDRRIFLYRPEGVAIFYSTLAYQTRDGKFVSEDGQWRHAQSGALFDPETESFVGGQVERLEGFDTFWYNWSLAHPETEVLRSGS